MKIIPLKIVNGLGARVAYWDEADVSTSDDLRIVHKDTVLFLLKFYNNTDGSTDVLRDLSGISSMRLTIRGGPDKTDSLYVFHSTYNTAAGGFTPDLANGFAVMAVPITDASGTPLATALAAATTTPDTYVEPWLEITMLEGGIPETLARFQLKILEEIDDGAAGTPSPTSPTYYTAAEVDALLVDYLKSTAATELTIAAGAVTPTTQHHTLDTEGDAATDDLTTISTATGWLYVRLANAARVVTLKHGTSANQISCPGGTDVEMQANAEYLLHRATTSDPWRMIGGSGGALMSQAEAEAGTATTPRLVSAERIAQAIAALETGEVNPDVISQAEAEAGTATTPRLFTAQRVKQAIDALGGGGGGGGTPVSDNWVINQTLSGTAQAIGSATGISLDITKVYHVFASLYANSGVPLVVQINNDATSANYRLHYLRASGTTVSADSNATANVIYGTDDAGSTGMTIEGKIWCTPGGYARFSYTVTAYGGSYRTAVGFVETLGTVASITGFQIVGSTGSSDLAAGSYLKVCEARDVTGGGGAPTGSIHQWPTTEAIPAGYLAAAGAGNRTTHGDLYTLIGTGYGAGDGSTTFGLPPGPPPLRPSSTDDVVALSAGTTGFSIPTVNLSNNNVYVRVYGGDIYMQTAGAGAFNALSAGTRNWAGMCYHPITGDVYASVDGGDIYVQTDGAGTFNALGGTSRAWRGMCVCPVTGNVYASVSGGDIYMQTAGSGTFDALSQTSRTWGQMAAALNGDIYCGLGGSGDVYVRAGGVGDFTALGQTSRTWGDGMCASPINGDIYSWPSTGTLYVRRNGIGNFVSLGLANLASNGIAVNRDGDLYVAVPGTDVYKWTNPYKSRSIVKS